MTKLSKCYVWLGLIEHVLAVLEIPNELHFLNSLEPLTHPTTVLKKMDMNVLNINLSLHEWEGWPWPARRLAPLHTVFLIFLEQGPCVNAAYVIGFPSCAFCFSVCPTMTTILVDSKKAFFCRAGSICLTVQRAGNYELLLVYTHLC